MILNKLSKLIRAISIPPLVVTIFIIILRVNSLINNIDALFLFIFLALIQLTAYPLSYLIPKFREGGRETQRNLAFIIGLIGYTGGLVYALTSNIIIKLEVLYITYFVSIIILFFINKVLKIRASGHMTSITGPLVGLLYFMGLITLIPSLIFYSLVFFSSLYLKRHTILEMIIGSFVTIGSFLLVFMLFSFI